MMDTDLTRRPRRPIRFRFAAGKALAAIHWMVRQSPGVDLHTVLKSCYLADKTQLNRWNQPIFGASYRAMRFGPVPLEIYEMAEGEALWLAEIGVSHVPWKLDGYRLQLTSNDAPDTRSLSDDDFSVLKDSFAQCTAIDFDARTELTHGRDWQAAELGMMQYEDMLDDTPDKAERIAYLSESAPYMAL